MDPLTHTLVGANLSATRLGEKTRFGAASLLVGANVADLDGLCYLIDSDLALGFRRGWTHGVLSLVVIPPLLAGLFLLIDRRWRGERRADFRWLLVLSAIAVWSHPTLDWLNTYGMRWLMPFSGRWFYGDAVFIMDVWLWLVLGVGYLAGKRASAGILATGLVIGAWIVRTVARRSPEYLPLLLAVAIVLIFALLWKTPVERPALSRRLATGALVIAGAYIAARLLLNEATENAVRRELARQRKEATSIMAGPHPIDPLRWSVVARTGDTYRYGNFDWRSRAFTLEDFSIEAALDSKEWRRAIRDPSVHGLVTWLRFPAYEVERRGAQTLVHIFDARRMGGWARRTVVLRD
jgi:inner membrane protein